MTNKKTTKRALLSSIMALFICFAMLLGTTYAWFTDSVKSANNIIKSGNLDIELEYWNGTEWKDVNDASDILTNTLWEPGVTEVAYLRVANAGSLALKYQLGINILNEVEGKNKANETFLLSDYIMFGVVEGVNGETDAYAQDNDGRDAAIAAAAATANGVDIISAGYTKAATMNPKDELYLALVVYMPTNVGNVANHNGTDIPQIDLGINVLATQAAVENDSFNNQYDANAWTEVAEVPTPDADGVVNVYTAEQLAGVMANATANSGITEINIIEDIDLGGRTWVPAFVSAPDLVINGNGHTISNMTTSGYNNVGFIGAAYQDITINDLTFKNAKVEATGSFVGGVIGNAWGGNAITFNNVDLVDSEVSTSVPTKAIRVGGLIGYSPYTRGDLTLKGCDVTGSTITGYHNVGAMVGTMMFYGPEQGSITIENCTAKNNTLKYGSPQVGAFDFGASLSGYEEYIPATGFTAENNKQVAVAIVSDANSLKSALTNPNSKNISIVLNNDIDMPRNLLIGGNAGDEYKMGNANTETIHIDLSGHKLNITTTYWSVLGTVNPDTVVTIENGTMTSSQTSGTWNSYDLTFASGKFVFENLVFEKAIALETNAVMKDVTINENHDYYALWISAEGQTVEIDGLTINSEGRGIKIDEQYVDVPAKVTLNVANADFNTVKKAAIMVKSAAGAKIALNNVDISDVKADYINAVWVDEDADAYASLVTVTGGEMISEANIVSSNTELTNAIANGATKVMLGAGNYTMPSAGSNAKITISGTKDAVIDLTNGAYMDSANVTIMGVTIKTGTGKVNGNGSDYAAFYTPNVTYVNCTFVGPMRVGRDGAKFTNCTFTELGNDYVWTYGNDVTFENCTFNTAGKAILIYSDGGNEVSKVTVKNCTFTSTQGAKAGAIANQNCAAIEIHNYGNGVDLVTAGNKYDANFSGEWRIKTYENGKPKVFVNGTEYTTIALDGKTMTIDADKNVTVAD